MWALQFEVDPLIRTEACHSIILLNNNRKDQELIDVLLDRHLIEEEPIVRKEIMDALIHIGHDPSKELPIVLKIKADIKKLNDKNVIIKKIFEIEKSLNFELEKKRLIWDEKDEDSNSNTKESIATSEMSLRESFRHFEPRLIEKSKMKRQSKNSTESKKNWSKGVSKIKSLKNDKNSIYSGFLSKLIKNESKELTLSLSSLNYDSNSFEEFLKENSEMSNSQEFLTDTEHKIFLKQHNAKVQPKRSTESFETPTEATGSSQKIQTILE